MYTKPNFSSSPFYAIHPEGKPIWFSDTNIYNNYEFERYPVIHLDFNEINYNKDLNEFDNDLRVVLSEHAKKYNVQIKDASAKAMFRDLIQKLSEINKVVILIDEYDKLIIEYMDDLEKSKKNKDFIASFYETIKAKRDYLRFVLLTGVTKVSKTSVFSKLNNLTDISLSYRYSGMLGITKKELYSNFKEYFAYVAKELEITEKEIKIKLEKWYNGYIFGLKLEYLLF